MLRPVTPSSNCSSPASITSTPTSDLASTPPNCPTHPVPLHPIAFGFIIAARARRLCFLFHLRSLRAHRSRRNGRCRHCSIGRQLQRRRQSRVLDTRQFIIRPACVGTHQQLRPCSTRCAVGYRLRSLAARPHRHSSHSAGVPRCCGRHCFGSCCSWRDRIPDPASMQRCRCYRCSKLSGVRCQAAHCT
jgi:hypothetical protein